MSLTTSEMSAADLAAVVDNNRNGNGFGGDGLYAILVVVFIIALMGGGFGGFGGFGNGFGNGFGGAMMGAGFADNLMMWPWMMSQNVDNDVQGGFNQMATANAINGLQSTVTSGFGDTQLGIAGINQNICQSTGQLQNALCNGFAGTTAAVTGAQNAVTQQLYNNELNSLNRSFAEQTANTQAINGLSSDLASCCCENRLATAGLQSVIQTENCADREAINNGVRDLLVSGTANTQNLLNTINSGIQSIQDKLCAQELEAERRENANLRQQLNMASLQASQTAQTAQLLADNAAQTQAVENYIRPQVNPAYIVPNPYGCNGYNYNGCGCNG